MQAEITHISESQPDPEKTRDITQNVAIACNIQWHHSMMSVETDQEVGGCDTVLILACSLGPNDEYRLRARENSQCTRYYTPCHNHN